DRFAPVDEGGQRALGGTANGWGGGPRSSGASGASAGHCRDTVGHATAGVAGSFRNRNKNKDKINNPTLTAQKARGEGGAHRGLSLFADGVAGVWWLLLRWGTIGRIALEFADGVGNGGPDGFEIFHGSSGTAGEIEDEGAIADSADGARDDGEGSFGEAGGAHGFAEARD